MGLMLPNGLLEAIERDRRGCSKFRKAMTLDGWKFFDNTGKDTAHCYEERGFRIGRPGPMLGDIGEEGILRSEAAGSAGVYCDPGWTHEKADALGDDAARAANEENMDRARERLRNQGIVS